MEKLTYLSNINPHISIHPDLVSILTAHKIDINDAAAYFVETFDKLRTCPPNYRLRKVKKDNIWILRDYYPETSVMFKMTMVYRTPEEIATYRHHPANWYSNSDGVLYVNVKLAKSNISNKLHVPYGEAQIYLKEKSVNIILGDNHKPKPFINRKVKKMRKMFPKGFYESRSNKRSPHIHNEATSNSQDVSADGSREL